MHRLAKGDDLPDSCMQAFVEKLFHLPWVKGASSCEGGILLLKAAGVTVAP